MLGVAKQSLIIGLKTRTVMLHRIIMDIFSMLIEYGALFLIWLLIYKFIKVEVFHSYSFRELMIYYGITISIYYLFYEWIDTVTMEISSWVRDGDISNYLSKPWNVLSVLYFQTIGSSLIRFIIAVSLLLFIVVITHINLTLYKLIVFMVLSILGLILLLSLYTLVGVLSFWYEESWSFSYLLSSLITLFSGRAIPLEFFPSYLRKIADILPFKYLYYSPAHLWLGRIALNQFLEIATMSIAYIILIALLVVWLWRRGIKKINIYGG